MRTIWVGIVGVVLLLLAITLQVRREKEAGVAYPPIVMEWKDLNEAEWGPLGRVSEYRPHDACSMCFTLPNYDEYQIYEYAKSDRPDGAIIIPRSIPNPAPEVMEREGFDPERGGYYDEDGEWTWFIGRQGFGGPTDREKWSDDLPVSTIEMKRVQARYMDRIMSIAGVRSFGIGPHGFVVDLLAGYEKSRNIIPADLEGLPIQTNIMSGEARFLVSPDEARAPREDGPE